LDSKSARRPNKPLEGAKNWCKNRLRLLFIMLDNATLKSAQP
jgi:hypothetical protein